MADWFRSWHGAPTDPKWRVIARRAGAPLALVVAVAWELMDRASQAEERGSIAGFDAESVACSFDAEVEQVEAIVSAMRDKSILDRDRFAARERRQPKREDETSTSRVQAHRERKAAEAQRSETVAKRDETHLKRDETLEEKRGEESRYSAPDGAGAAPQVPPSAAEPEPSKPPPDPDADLYRRARELLGPKAGGQVTKLKAGFAGDVAKTREFLEYAATRDDPAAFIAKTIAKGVARSTGPPERQTPEARGYTFVL